MLFGEVDLIIRFSSLTTSSRYISRRRDSELSIRFLKKDETWRAGVIFLVEHSMRIISRSSRVSKARLVEDIVRLVRGAS